MTDAMANGMADALRSQWQMQCGGNGKTMAEGMTERCTFTFTMNT
jgi:hypothetical protein